MLRGNALAKVDGKGRLKVPTKYRSVLEPKYGNEFFVTSYDGECVRVYPMDVYEGLEQRLQNASMVQSAVVRLRRMVNYYGQAAQMDASGRILIHPLLRERTATDGEVAVLGQQNYLEVWNRAAFEATLEPFSRDERSELAALGF